MGVPLSHVVYIGYGVHDADDARHLRVPYLSAAWAGKSPGSGVQLDSADHLTEYLRTFLAKQRLWLQENAVAGSCGLADFAWLSVAAESEGSRAFRLAFFCEHLFTSLALSDLGRWADVWTVDGDSDGSDRLLKLARARSCLFGAPVVRLPLTSHLPEGRSLAGKKALLLQYCPSRHDQDVATAELTHSGATSVRCASLFTTRDDNSQLDFDADCARYADEMLAAADRFVQRYTERRRRRQGTAEERAWESDDADGEHWMAHWSDANRHETRFGDKRLGWLAHEGGAFGSVSLYDDYSDEGEA